MVAVDHSQLWTKASEAVVPIDWPLQSTVYGAVPPERRMDICKYTLQIMSVESGYNPGTIGTLGHSSGTLGHSGYK